MIPHAPNPQAGFSLIEMFLAGMVLAVAMTAYVGGVITHRSLVQEESSRSQALLRAEQFLERLRTDDDFPGLYARLRLNAAAASSGGGASYTFSDGRHALPPANYYPDYQAKGPLGVLVEVPSGVDVNTGLPILREDIAAPDFGLPADLNGDGVIGSAARDGDYEAIPVVVRFIWPLSKVETRELRVVTWLRGER